MRIAHACLCLILLAGCGRAEPPKPPADLPPASAPGDTEPAQVPAVAADPASAGTPAWLDDAGAATIPNAAAGGLLGGRPFVVRQATLENGILQLADSDEFIADNRFLVFLFLDKGQVPQGRTFAVGKKRDFHNPHVHIAWKDAGGKTQSDAYMDQYTMKLEFGTYADGRLPGKLYLCLPDTLQSRVAGSFNAEVRGFRILDGKADRTVDATDLLEHLALERLQAQNPGKQVELADRENASMTQESKDRKQVGCCTLKFSVAGGPEQRLGFTFRKENDGWALIETIPAHQLAEAHLPESVGHEEAGLLGAVHAAARFLEEEAQQKFPGKAFVLFDTGNAHTMGGQGGIEVEVQMEGEAEPTRRRFEVKLEGGDWTVVKEVPTDGK